MIATTRHSHRVAVGWQTWELAHTISQHVTLTVTEMLAVAYHAPGRNRPTQQTQDVESSVVYLYTVG